MMGRPARGRHRLAAAGLLGVLALSGCGNGTPSGALAGTLEACPADATPIHSVQGREFDSPLLGQPVTVTGIVTLATADGAYIESLLADDDPRTSEGLFLSVPLRPDELAPGTVITASGNVAELGERRDTQTALVGVNGLARCGAPAPRPLAEAALPLGGRDKEALESMRVRLQGVSVVSDVYELRDRGFRLSLDAPLAQPTEVARPGREADRQGAANWDRSLFARLFPGDDIAFAVGDELLSDEGVLGHDGKGPRLLLDAPARILRHPLPDIRAPAPGVVRVVSLNLQNYFNGDGHGGGFPTARGAKSPADFETQRRRLAAQVAQLKPHVVGVMELENDGFGPSSAAADFLADLERSTGGAWAVANPGVERIGSDEITVGLFFRRDALEAVGPALLLDAAPFDLLSRVPVAQVLRLRSNGGRILVNVNHFKSKGSCPDQGRDRDQGDGQGCWNAARTAAAKALAPWVKAQAEESADGRGLVIGDLNAYRIEDPVQQLLMEGFADLTAPIGEWHHYSYVYFGASGTLDHALATTGLLRDVSGALIYNVNAGYPRSGPRDSGWPDWVGASDHDPVIVDLRLTQSSTSD